MAEETDSTTAGASDAADTSATEETTGGKRSGGARPSGGASKAIKVPEPLKTLQLGDQDDPAETKWVIFLQGMLNYHYQVLTVAESGYFDSETAKAVQRFRSENGLGYGDHVDEDVWHALGVEAETKGKGKDKAKTTDEAESSDDGQSSFENIFLDDVSFVDAPNDDTCWAATLAMVLNRSGNSYDVDSLCEEVGVSNQDRKTWQEARSIGTGLGMYAVSCDCSSPENLAGVLKHSGPLWTPVPADDYRMIVVTGVWNTDGQIDVHVLDPVSSHADWMEFDEFIQTYGFGSGHAELLAA